VTADGNRITKTIAPAELKDGEDPRIGVLLPRPGSSNSIEVDVVGYERPGIAAGSTDAIREMRAITWGNLTGLSRVVFDSKAREQVGSVVGIVQVADEVSRAGQMLRYVGIISLILAVMNLLPLLPLDGGHLLFGFLEAIRKGRPMPKVAFERYSALGLGLVLVLFMIGLNNDLGRAFGG
jgi:regulator of sigma E protease